MLVNFMSTYFLPHFLHKFQPVRLTGGLCEGEVIIYCLYVGGQGVENFAGIIWRELRSLFMVDQIGFKTHCFFKNGLGGRHGHRCKEVNEAKYFWYAISFLVFFLNYFTSP